MWPPVGSSFLLRSLPLLSNGKQHTIHKSSKSKRERDFHRYSLQSACHLLSPVQELSIESCNMYLFCATWNENGYAAVEPNRNSGLQLESFC